ncbi:type II secretion system F family protein [Brevundimonas terrae]|uniref:Type II secretion system F family protein n=1 Tax=Brevundimonas terrae TaxID=363631 RepID=A0ABP3HUP9_9CAUL|nr:type II secretion system F family protein [Brevundimonas terrae]NIJ27534.1 tight adherence protein C [Brevundimonas terrae]
MEDFIRFMTTPQNLLSIGVGVAVFASLFTLLSGMGGGQSFEKRIKHVADRRADLRRRSRASMQGSNTPSLRQTDEGFKKRVVDRLNISTLLEDPKITEQIMQAGFRGQRPVTTFYFFRVFTPLILAAVVAFYLFVVTDFNAPLMTKIAGVAVAIAIGFYGPNIYLSNHIQKRRQKIVEAFPDALDLLLICVESGMSIEAAIQKVSQEIGSQSLELAEELSLMSAELSYLPDRRMAYDNLAKRTNHPGIKSVATAMTQAETYGTPLSTALRTMAKENRELRLATAEKKAAALPAQLTVPMIIFFLPVLFVVIMGPAVISIIDMMG